MGDLLFAKHTSAILNMLPHWFKIRKESKDSLGARFLNISGLRLDDLRYVIDYAYQQCYISSIDINQVDFCYKAILPMPLKSSEIKSVFANNVGLIKAENIKQFFGIDQNSIKNRNMHSFEFYYVDEKRNIIYVRNKFNVDALYDNGKIKFIFKDGNEYIQRLIPHHVWNFFDELGALVSCPRIFGEPNFEYKERIIDVFTNKANSSKQGLINGIGRELAIRRNVVWDDPKKDLELEDAMIVLNSITLDGEYIDMSKVFLTETGTVLIKAIYDENDKDISSKLISYVYGLEMHQFFNHDDIKLYNELYTVEGKPKTKLKQYIKILNSESPIFWNNFNWNEHYWDTNNQDVSGLGCIPNLYDGSIRGFKSYGIVNDK